MSIVEMSTMKLLGRQRVDGTNVTIGRRVYYRDGNEQVSKKYSAEYRDLGGRQCCQGLGTTNRSQAVRLAVEIQQRLEKGIEKTRPSRITIEGLIKDYLEIVQAKGAAPKTISKYSTDLEKLKEFCKTRNLRFARQYCRIIGWKLQPSPKQKQGRSRVLLQGKWSC